MARKRLNKKVVFIGSFCFLVVVAFLILAILRLSRSPGKFIEDGDAAVKAAQEAGDEETRTKQYERAERSYSRARSLAKTDSLRVEILFKLSDMYVATDQWPKVLGCWKNIVRLDTNNARARYGQLKYFYLLADSGSRGAWQEVASQASEFLEAADNSDLLTKGTAEWDPFGDREKTTGAEQLGLFLYLVRGRANLEIGRMGTSTDRDATLAQAIEDLKKVQELEPGNVDAGWYLAQAVITKGEILASRGEPHEKDKAAEQAKAILERAVEAADSNPKAYTNLLSIKLKLAGRVGAGLTEKQFEALEPEYLSVVEKFPSSAEVFSALAGFYRYRPKNLDKAMEAAEKAVELDKTSATYAINAAGLHYRKFSIYGEKPELYKAIEETKKALTLPDAQDRPGPRQWANKMNRIFFYDFLAKCYIEQIIEPRAGETGARKEELLTEAEQAVHEIEQLFGVGEAPQVIKAQGMLELARGNRSAAVRKLYAAYQQFKASKPAAPPFPADPQYADLCYTLAKVFWETSEVGAVSEFMANALYSGIVETRPEAILDYAEVLLKLNLWADAVSNVQVFEEHFWTNERSRVLHLKALIGGNQFEDAEKELAKMPAGDSSTITLKLALVQAKVRQIERGLAQKQIKETSRAIIQKPEAPEKEGAEPEGSVQLMTSELRAYRGDVAELVGKLLEIEPNSVEESSVIGVCNSYVAEGNIDGAKALIDRFLGHSPNNTLVLFYRQMLSEPEPRNISEERRREIEEQVLSNIADPVQRAIDLGRLYHSYNELEKAAVEFRKVFKTQASQEGKVEKTVTEGEEERALRRLAATYLFEIALSTKDWAGAEQIADRARTEDFDDCEGLFFAGRLAAAKGEYKDALTWLDKCLKERPVFSRGYLLRSNVNAALGNEYSSIEDAQKGAALNPLDGTIAKGLAVVLTRRNQKLGDNVSSEQMIEAKRALLRAISLNPGDLQLRSFYAEFISSTEPANALAIRQQLQKVAPSVENALSLGFMAMRMAVNKTASAEKNALLDIAGSSFEQARALDPQNEAVLAAQAEYYRVIGQPEKAQESLVQAQDEKLLWVHYYRLGKFEDAKKVLEQLYKSGPKDSDVVKGLLAVAEKTVDQDAAKKYSEELLSLEGSVDNHLIQIQSFLKTGLVKEAEYKLQSFKEKYPDEPRALLLEGWSAMMQGQLTRALELTNRYLASNQKDALAWRLRGEINLLKTDYSQAIEDFQTSKSLQSDSAGRVGLAKAYLGAGRQEDAITELKSLIDHPQTARESGRGPRELLERIYQRSGRKEALRELYDKTIEEFPEDVRWYNRAAAFAAAQGKFGRAEQLYTQVLQKGEYGGDYATALDGYLQALILAAGTPNSARSVWDPRKLEKVFEEGRKYVDSDIAPIAYLRMAEAKAKLGDKATAIEYCQKGMAKAFGGADEILASKVLRRTYSLLGAEEVLKCCKQRLETDPDSLVVNLTMSDLMTIRGEYNEALRYVDKCLQIAGPASPQAVGYLIRKVAVLDLAYNKTSDNNYLKRIVTECESLLVKLPNNMIALNNLAYVLAKNNERLDEALKYAERACEAQPNNPVFLDTYAFALYKNGKKPEADATMQAAIQQYELQRMEVPAEVYEHLGTIKEELGAKTEAVEAYKKALEAGEGKLSGAARQAIEAAIERLSGQEGTKG